MGFREVSVIEVKEVLRAWLEGAGTRTAGARAGVDRKTARRYVEAAQAAGLERSAGFATVDDALVGQVVAAVRPARPNGHGQAWEVLAGREEQIRDWVAGREGGRPLTIVKIHELLTRQGCVVPYRTLHRFATERCGYRPKATTVPVVDGEPGVECQIDFGYLGWLVDPETGQRRKLHALIFTAVVSRHLFVWLTHAQTLAAVIAGCEAAWMFFGGVFKVLVPDNLKPVVTRADAVNPQLSTGWLDYAQHAGFVTDPARVRSPRDKPRVERAVQFVRNSFWAGESFADLADAQRRAEAWCVGRAGMRIHGSLQARPLEVFRDREAGVLLPVPAPYDMPIFARVKVHRDFHVEVGRSLYSAPRHLLGQYLDARADSQLVRLYANGRLIKCHPRQPPGRRSTDPADLPAEKTGYALRDLTRLIGVCAGHGPNIGIYAERLLDDPLPWTRMRAVYRLLGLVRRYGPGPVEQACATALDLDVISVSKIDSMLTRATETTAPSLPGLTPPAGRFARDPAEYTLATHGTGPATEGTGLATEGTGLASEGTGLASEGTGHLVVVRGAAAEEVSA
ncbi:MAG TPA: IS21 family transposase [Actinomycetota bacterium]|nr:IS21 family transposase [Actinomycetota bacterium]